MFHIVLSLANLTNYALARATVYPSAHNRPNEPLQPIIWGPRLQGQID